MATHFIGRSVLLPLLLIGGIIAALYGPFLSNPLVFDDVNVFEVRSLAGFRQSAFSLVPRWLPYVSFAWTQSLLGPDIFWQRLGNLALHLANAGILFVFLRRLLSIVLSAAGTSSTHGRQDALPVFWLAFFGALLFAIHPAAVYGVAYLVQRTILMATLFSLLMWWLLLEGVVREKQTYLLGSALAYGFAVFSKEHAVMAPAVAAALVILVRGIDRRTLRQVLPAFVLYVLVGILVVYQLRHAGIFGQAYEPMGADMLGLLSRQEAGFDPALAYPLSVLTQSFLFFKYLLIWIVPNPLWMSVDMYERFALKFLSWPHIAGAAGFVVYFVVAVRLLFRRGSKGLLGFAMLCPWFMFVAEFSTVRIQESFVVYRSYLWMPGIVACLPFVFRNVQRRRALAMLLALTVAMLPVTWDRLTTFSHELLLWNDAARLVSGKEDRPGVERIYLNRCISFYEVLLFEDAIKDCDKALSIQPKYIVAYSARGVAFLAIGEYDKAGADFAHAIRLNPRYGHAYLGRGRLHELQKDMDAARRDFGTGCALGFAPACGAARRLAIRDADAAEISDDRVPGATTDVAPAAMSR